MRTRRPLSISHWMASVISSSPRADGSIARTASWMCGVEEVDADERQVGRRVGRLLDQPHDLAVAVELGDAEAVGVGHLCEQDLAPRARLRVVGVRPTSKRLDEVGEVLLQQVVAEVHHEVVVGEEVAGDEHAVRQAERGVLGDVGDLDARARRRRRRRPSISSAVSPTMMPISMIPASAMASIP